MTPVASAPTTWPLQKVSRNCVCSMLSPTRLIGPPTVSVPVRPGGQEPEDVEPELDSLCEELELLELDEDEDEEEPDADEPLEEPDALGEHGAALLTPSSATIIVQRSCAGVP